MHHSHPDVINMEYFTIVLKEGSSENMGLFTEKLNEGYYLDNKIQVGKSTTLVLRNNKYEGKNLREEQQDVPGGYTLGNGIISSINSQSARY